MPPPDPGAPDIRLSGPALPVATCARRLGALGWRAAPHPALDATAPGAWLEDVVLRAHAGRAPSDPLDCRIRWGPPGRPELERPSSEATVQAELGLMHLHGLDAGRPRRLGIEVASVAAGMAAAQAVLAALVGRCRGAAVAMVETSVLGAAALLIAPSIARAGAAGARDASPAMTAHGGPGPPFPTVDGRWVEVETLAPESWRAFWEALGVAPADIVSSWAPFSARYSASSCSLPPGLHAATRRMTHAALAELAGSSGMSLCPVRTIDEVLADAGTLSTRHPLLSRLDDVGGERPPAASAGRASSASPSRTEAIGPLHGLTVVEATSRVQGPLAGQLLRMLGARVVRIEPPGGDPARLAPPFAGDTGAFFLAMNRGKEPVEADLRSVPGRRRVVELLGEADVFLHNWRSGRATERGLDRESLRSRRPRLVHCHASGWGAAAAGCPPLAMEYLVQAHAGLGELLSPVDEPPLPTRLLVADTLGALLACEGVLAGLWRRERTGAGCAVDTSLLGGAMALAGHIIDDRRAGHERGRTRGRPVWGPLDRPLRTADGWLAVDPGGTGPLPRRRDPNGGPDPAVMAAWLAQAAAPARARELAGAGMAAAAVLTDLRELRSAPRTAAVLEPVGGVPMVAAPWRFPGLRRWERARERAAP